MPILDSLQLDVLAARDDNRCYSHNVQSRAQIGRQNYFLCKLTFDKHGSAYVFSGSVSLYISMSSHSYSSVINLSKLKQHVLLFLQIYQYYIGSSELSSRKTASEDREDISTTAQQHSTAQHQTAQQSNAQF